MDLQTEAKAMERERSRVMKESIPKQLDKKSGVQEEEKGVWGSQRGDRGLEFSRRKKGQMSFFPLYIP